MKEIEKNKQAWNLLAEDHYHHYKKELLENGTIINHNILSELGDISSKSLIHLQCNGGADTVCLARLGLAKAVGVDLANENIFYANKLKHDFKMDMVSFIESDVLELGKIHHEKYDIVFTSEGVLGWLPDLKKWAKVVRGLMKEDGFFYIYDSHPFFHIFDHQSLANHQQLVARYPYFNAEADLEMEIGGYASEEKVAENYWWNHSLYDIINALVEAGLRLEFIHEFDTLFWDNGNMDKIDKGLYQYSSLKGKLPMSYSIKARL